MHCPKTGRLLGGDPLFVQTGRGEASWRHAAEVFTQRTVYFGAPAHCGAACFFLGTLPLSLVRNHSMLPSSIIIECFVVFGTAGELYACCTWRGEMVASVLQVLHGYQELLIWWRTWFGSGRCMGRGSSNKSARSSLNTRGSDRAIGATSRVLGDNTCHQ